MWDRGIRPKQVTDFAGILRYVLLLCVKVLHVIVSEI